MKLILHYKRIRICQIKGGDGECKTNKCERALGGTGFERAYALLLGKSEENSLREMWQTHKIRYE